MANTMTLISSVTVGVGGAASIDFTSIPSWVKRVTVMFNGVSLSGSASPLIQIGSGSVVTTGYVGSTVGFSATISNVTQSTIGLQVSSASATDSQYGSAVIQSMTGNAWVMNSVVGTNTIRGAIAGASISLSGALDRVRITTTNGTDTFDAGTINLLWE